jgi:hypothetical protein
MSSPSATCLSACARVLSTKSRFMPTRILQIAGATRA